MHTCFYLTACKMYAYHLYFVDTTSHTITYWDTKCLKVLLVIFYGHESWIMFEEDF